MILCSLKDKYEEIKNKLFLKILISQKSVIYFRFFRRKVTSPVYGVRVFVQYATHTVRTLFSVFMEFPMKCDVLYFLQVLTGR
jgi:hypothetical protein